MQIKKEIFPIYIYKYIWKIKKAYKFTNKEGYPLNIAYIITICKKRGMRLCFCQD